MFGSEQIWFYVALKMSGYKGYGSRQSFEGRVQRPG